MSTKKKLEAIKRRKSAIAPGIFPGMNRSRKFVNKKKKANKQACRGRVRL